MKVVFSTRRIMAITFLLFATATCGCLDNVAQRKAANEIKKLLPQYLGPAEAYDVEVEGTAGQIRQGKMKHVHVVGINLQPFDLPRLSRIEADINNIQIDIRNKIIISSETAHWTGWIDQNEFTSILMHKVTYIDNILVELTPGIVSVSGKVSVRGVGPSAKVDAVPEVRNGKQLWMIPTKIHTSGLGIDVPEWGQKKIDPFINPVFTVPDNKLNIKINTLASQSKSMKITGTFDPLGFNP